MGYDNLNDEKLVEMAQAGNIAAGDALLRRFKGIVSMLARPYFIMGGDREDLVQEGMIGLYKAMREYKGGATFATFAAACVKNQILDAVRSAARKKHGPLNSYVSISAEGDELSGLADSRGDPEEIMIRREDRDSLEKAARASLSPKESTILKHFLAGLSYSEIAAVLGSDTKSVDNALYRIRRKMAREVKNG